MHIFDFRATCEGRLSTHNGRSLPSAATTSVAPNRPFRGTMAGFQIGWTSHIYLSAAMQDVCGHQQGASDLVAVP
jgi:hypothetical protein